MEQKRNHNAAISVLKNGVLALALRLKQFKMSQPMTLDEWERLECQKPYPGKFDRLDKSGGLD